MIASDVAEEGQGQGWRRGRDRPATAADMEVCFSITSPPTYCRALGAAKVSSSGLPRGLAWIGVSPRRVSLTAFEDDGVSKWRCLIVI